MREDGQPSGRVTRWLPYRFLAAYKRRLLRGDVIAGVTVAALIIPKNLGYAGIAGVPLQNGLYAAAAGALLYPAFGTSRQISMGPSSGIAAVAGSAVLTSQIADPHDQAAFVAGMTLIAGLLFLVLAVLRMGWVGRFLSRAVVTGFLFGAAIDVVIGELPRLTGTDVDGATPLHELWNWFGSLSASQGLTCLVGGLALLLVFGLRVWMPRLPAALLLVTLGLVASYVFDLAEHGVAVVGNVPRGIPAPVLPNPTLMWHHLDVALLAAVALVMIGFSQTVGDARTFASKHGYPIDVDHESLGQSAANVGAGLFQGMPVSTSLSASSLNDRSGARSGVASLTSGLVVLATLLLLAPVFSKLPEAVLAAIIIEAVVTGMMNVPEMRRMARVQRFDFLVAVVALASTLIFGVLAGVLIGIGLSLLWLVSVATRPRIALLGHESGTQVFRDLDENPGDVVHEGVCVIRLDGGLFFATADALDDRVRALIEEDEELRSVVLDLEGVNFMDSQGTTKVRELALMTRDAGISLRLARVKPSVATILDRDGVTQEIGPSHIHGNVFRAVDAALNEVAPPTPSGDSPT